MPQNVKLNLKFLKELEQLQYVDASSNLQNNEEKKSINLLAEEMKESLKISVTTNPIITNQPVFNNTINQQNDDAKLASMTRMIQDLQEEKIQMVSENAKLKIILQEGNNKQMKHLQNATDDYVKEVL